jgi:geranylgeranyl diphosphate synthase type II
LHRLYGVPLAINAGDLLSLMSLQPLLENIESMGPELALRILEETALMGQETAEGQAMELGWRQENTTALSTGDYLRMVLKKTCWLASIYPIRVGALIGTHGTVDVDALFRFGFFLGASFQIQDDILNLVQDDGRYGKERDGDLWEGKRTLMLIHLFHYADATEQEQLHEFLKVGRDARTLDQVRWMHMLILKHGSVNYAQRVASALAGAALHEFNLLFEGFDDSSDKEFLREVIPWVIERQVG